MTPTQRDELLRRLRDPRNQFLFDPDVSAEAWSLLNDAAKAIESALISLSDMKKHIMEALQFYAAESTYEWDIVTLRPAIENDKGAKAREALSQPTSRVELDDISRAHVVTAEELRQKATDDMRVLAPTSDEGTPKTTRDVLVDDLIAAKTPKQSETPLTDAVVAKLIPGFNENEIIDLCVKLELTLHAKERELAELRYWAEEYECAMKCLDDAKVPRGEQKGEHFANYSLWGRITEFATLQSVSAAPQEAHDWECVSPGEYDSLYQCRRCRAKHMTQADKDGTDLPISGCTPQEGKADELPGMWDRSDLIGGETDCELPPATPRGDGGEVPEPVMQAVDRMCRPLDPSRLSGATAQEDARCMNLIREFDDVHAHHDDYSKRLDVKWLCPIHHAARHRELPAPSSPPSKAEGES